MITADLAALDWIGISTLGAAAVFTYGVGRRIMLWRRGRPRRFETRGRDRRRSPQERWSERPLLPDRFAAISHGILITAAIVLVVFHQDVLSSPVHLVVQSAVVEIAALVAIATIIAVLWRGRIGAGPNIASVATRAVLVALVPTLLIGLVLESLKMGPWSALSALLAVTMGGSSLDPLLQSHPWLWRGHVALALFILAILPFSSFTHIILVPLNRLLHAAERRAGPVAPDLRLAAAPLDAGVTTLGGFTWRDLVDIDSCTNCAQCDLVCPVHGVSGPLSPRAAMQGMQRAARRGQTELSLVTAGAISSEALWACTTCGACSAVCPSAAAPLPKLTELRRGELEAGRLPPPLARPMESLQHWGNPFGEPPERRGDWILSLPRSAQSADRSEAPLLYWVGCAGAYNAGAQRATIAFAKVLHQAGVPFQILGTAERCCGEPARRADEEGLFRDLAEANVAAIAAVSPSRIVTGCAHCLHVLREEYGAFAFPYEVIHHTELLAELGAQKKLKPAISGSVTFHDPCYLGRHCGVFEAPRQAMASASFDIAEMAASRAASRCCGAGGGQLWLAAGGQERIDVKRIQDAVDTKADTVVTACPYCKIMLEDAANTHRERVGAIQVKDVAELFTVA